jgi:hypothetical protein
MTPEGLSGTVNLTLPLATLMGWADSPGELGGFGPVTGHSARDIALETLAAPAVRWCVTITGSDDEAIAHGCATRKRARAGGWTFTVKISALARGECGHNRESAGYQLSPSLRHIIEIRNQRCTYPGCRRSAAKCDMDHTIPYDKGGRSCECNIAPLCRYHHILKQSEGWRLEQPEPGTLAWITPAGWKYITGPDAYPT